MGLSLPEETPWGIWCPEVIVPRMAPRASWELPRATSVGRGLSVARRNGWDAGASLSLPFQPQARPGTQGPPLGLQTGRG